MNYKRLLRKWFIFIQLITVNGFSAYFHINYTPMDYATSINYCRSIGMELVKLDNPGLHNSAGQFLLDQSVAEVVWISIDCLNVPCTWGDGEPVTWTKWKTTMEPIYQCAVLEYANLSFQNWLSRKCNDLYISLCYAPPHPLFQFLSGPYNFEEASDECKLHGGQLAVLNNPQANNRAKNEVSGYLLSADIWIGLYGDGVQLTWQNMNEGVTYSDWDGAVPVPTSGSAVVMDVSSFRWKGKETALMNHALCQINYMPNMNPLNYTDAKAYCDTNGLQLAKLRSEEDIIIATNSILQYSVVDNYWIGLTYNGASFEWSDGSPNSYTDWAIGEPNNIQTAQCVLMSGADNFQWDTKVCSDPYYFICQYPTRNAYPITQAVVMSEVTTTNQITAGSLNQRYFQKDAIDAEPNINRFEVLSRDSYIQCARSCLARPNCVVFAYKNTECSLYDSYNAGSLIASVDSTVWI